MTPILVDARNFPVYAPELKRAIAADTFIALDVETEDSQRHAGLNALQKRRRPIDHRRNRLCGASFYSESMDNRVYYLDVGHATIENRLSFDQLREILDSKRPEAWWIAHNSPFEITTLHYNLGYALDPQIICTMQLAVSTITPTEFSHHDWIGIGQGEIARLTPRLMQLAMSGYDMADGKMSSELEEFIGKIIAKESKAAFSYNGLVKSISYGYGLKGLVKRFFGVQMTTYDEVLAGAGQVSKTPASVPDDDDDDAGEPLPEEFGAVENMGELTGEQVVAYGADDAYWALKLFHALIAKAAEDNPTDGGEALLNTFFTQENPMCAVYARIAQGGMRVNFDAIFARRDLERAETAKILRNLKSAISALLPFADEPSTTLLKYDTGARWYEKNHIKYRDQLVRWASSRDDDDDFAQVIQCRGAVASSWADEKGLKTKTLTGPNLTHYMPVRVLLYDLIGAKAIVSQGKLESDGEARGKIKDKLTDTHAIAVLEGLTALAGVEQRMKLYLTPYTRLTDPDTGRLYPTVTSMLATRRMAARDPNPMQLAKRGASTYVRGFFGPDHDDHVIVSIDWSSIELVEVAEFSGDPKFCEAYSSLPHKDLHAGAAAQILGVEVPDLTVEIFKDMPNRGTWQDFNAKYPIENGEFLSINLKGEAITQPAGSYKYWRTEVGKGANFNFFYSGWLATIGERMGWSPQVTAEATEKYASYFEVAEAWRKGVIEEVQLNGFITLPDHHRYVRYEATARWAAEWMMKFTHERDRSAYGRVISMMGRKLSRRAGNQTVNALIQGSCATIAKRSILRIETALKAKGWTDRQARFMVPIHDELVFSVHRSLVAEFIEAARGIMIDHPDIFKLCKLDASPSVGLTFEPWHETKAPLGQVELFELPGAILGQETHNKRATPEQTQAIVDWLFECRDGKLRIAA